MMDKASSSPPPALGSLSNSSIHCRESDDQSLAESYHSVESCVSGNSATTRNSQNTGSRSQDAIVDSLASVVGRWRACVVIMLIITSTLVVTTTYIFLSQSEQEEFQKSVGTK
jgi:hypothetical protein